MILIYGSLHDEMTELMCARLEQLRFKYLHIDPEYNPENYFTWKSNGTYGKTNAIIQTGKVKIRMKDITGIYARFAIIKRKQKIRDLSAKEVSSVNYESQSAFINFMNNFPGVVINRVPDSVSNDSKIYQQLQISKQGFFTPKTLVTNNPERAKKFYNECNGKVIFKSLSSVRSIVTQLTNPYFARLKFLKNCPVQFQELIEGLEIRVHTAGDKIFATAIESEAIDYRYAGKYKKSARFFEYELPEKTAKSCMSLSQSLGFTVAGIDLKKTKDGKYYCFEVNPSPAFIVYERMTGQPISTEVAKILNGSVTHRTGKENRYDHL